MIEIFEWIGCAAGLCGAALLAVNHRRSGWGFVLFLASNFAWILYGLLIHADGLVVMQIGFTLTSLIGIWKWLVAPRLLIHKICG